MSFYGPLTVIPNEKFPWRSPQKSLEDPYPISVSKDWFQNDYGMYRWHLIRAAYWDNVIDEDFVCDLFCDWRDTSEYFMLNGLDIESRVRLSAFVKASKRGNDVYKVVIQKKFGFLDGLPPLDFFCEEWGHKTSPMLFITLTVDPKKHSLQDAWLEIGKELNRFETLLRQKYGTFVKFRVWEAHKSGHPHAHIVYYFHNTNFEVFEYWSTGDSTVEPQRSWRIADKHRDAIKGMWCMGNADIQAVQDTLGAFSEVKKYVTKKIWGKKADLTNAMLTLFRKQSYSISLCDPLLKVPKVEPSLSKLPDMKPESIEKLSNRENLYHEKCRKKDFIGSIWGLDTYLEFYRRLHLANETLAEPGLSALVKETMCNYNIEVPEIVKWEFVGFILGADLFSFYPKFEDRWSFGVKGPPQSLFACVNIPEAY